jgi:hypothetical protein
VRGIRRVVSRVRGSSSRIRATTSCSQDASEPYVSPLFTDWTRDNTGQPSEFPPVIVRSWDDDLKKKLGMLGWS